MLLFIRLYAYGVYHFDVTTDYGVTKVVYLFVGVGHAFWFVLNILSYPS